MEWEGEPLAEPLSRCELTPYAAQQELRPPDYQPPFLTLTMHQDGFDIRFEI